MNQAKEKQTHSKPTQLIVKHDITVDEEYFSHDDCRRFVKLVNTNARSHVTFY